MTVLNTNYTSLEDAWGSNFEVVNTGKKHRKKKGSVDPLCELYGRRNRKAKKPFSTDRQKPSRFASYKNRVPEDMNQYYGYSDDDMPATRSAKPKDTPFLGQFESGVCESVTQPYGDDGEDDEYLENAVIQEESTDFKKIFSNVYDESDDEVQMECEPRVTSERDDLRSISRLIEEEFQKYNFNPNRECFVDERQYLDLMMYTLSGVILIFMMEQFIQIGMKLKTPY